MQSVRVWNISCSPKWALLFEIDCEMMAPTNSSETGTELHSQCQNIYISHFKYNYCDSLVQITHALRVYYPHSYCTSYVYACTPVSHMSSSSCKKRKDWKLKKIVIIISSSQNRFYSDPYTTYLKVFFVFFHHFIFTFIIIIYLVTSLSICISTLTFHQFLFHLIIINIKNIKHLETKH